MCWNDFIDCNFTGADLTGADLRASLFERCCFTGATLLGADVRQSTFDGCNFGGAKMNGCTAELAQRDDIAPDAEQAGTIAWQSEPGPEAPGG